MPAQHPLREAAPTGEPGQPPRPARMLSTRIARLEWLPPALARRIFGAPLAPTAAEWRAIEAALWRGDPPMDELVAWMFEDRPRERKAKFERALTGGIESLHAAPEPLRAFFALVDRDPPWLDRERLPAGIRASRLAGDAGFYVLRDLALMGGYSYFNSMNHTLALAGALTKDTALRIGETGKWLTDVTEDGGLERFGPGFVSTLRVRLIHALIRRAVARRPEWDAERWGVPINQVDMLATYLAFGPVSLLGVRLFGVPVGRADAGAAMHLWRYVGHLSGVDESFLARTEGDGLRKLYHTFLTHRWPDDTARRLGTALRDEPLRRYVPGHEERPRLAALRRRFAYHQHLSNTSLILGPLRRRQLGLPILTLPWYPMLSSPIRFATVSYHRLRGGAVLEGYLARSRTRQRALLDSYFANREHDLLRPGADHPAHVG